MMKKIIFSLIICLCLCWQAFGKVPYKLKKGQVIDAKRLNLNFEYMDREDDSSWEYEVTAAGKHIGHIRFNSLLYFQKDFRPLILKKDGSFKNVAQMVYFKESDCQGDFYHVYMIEDQDIFYVPYSHGRVFVYNGALYYFAPNETTIYRITALSAYYNGSCSNVTMLSPGLYIKYKPNKPSVTGIETWPFPQPIKLIDRDQDGNAVDFPSMTIIDE